MAKIFTMLALLLTAASGAWAQTAFIMKEVTADMVPTTWNGDETSITVDDLPGFISVDMDAAKAWTGAPSDGYVTIFYSVNGTMFSELNYDNGNGPSEGSGSYERRHFYYRMYNPGYKIYYTAAVPVTYTEPVDMTSLKVGDILAEGFRLTSTNPTGAVFNIASQRGKKDETIQPGGYGIDTKNITEYGANATFTTADGTYYPIDENSNVGNAWVVTQECTQFMGMDFITIAGVTIEPPLKVTWDATTKTGTFTMPASDVVLTPLYAPVAQWATESDVKLLPTAAEGIFAGTDAPLIVEGTVAPGQGQVMYAVTSTNQATAPELGAFSATVPTAENIADEGADVLVWYYIQGADTPDGQTATAENTFNDSEICATPLEVSVLSNQFDITLNAANANTIENGKATVTVGGTAATVTEGKLEGVKMGSEVKMTAKQGYKFRKVEAKKTAAAPAGPTLAETMTTAGMTVKVNFNYNGGNYCQFLSNGNGTYTFQSGGGFAGGYAGWAKALVVENGKLVFKQNNTSTIDEDWHNCGYSVTFDTSNNTYTQWAGGSAQDAYSPSFTSVEVNGTQIAVNIIVDETGD